MFKQTQGRKWVSRLAIVTASLVIAACGGEESEKKSTSSSGGSGGAGTLVCIAYLLVSGNDDCLSQVGSSSGGSSSGGSTGSSSGGSTDSGSGGSTSTGYTGSTPIKFIPFDEFEPNNTLPNANWVNLPKTYDRDGFIADGSVHDVNDQADVYNFSRPQPRYFAFRLCSDGQVLCDSYGEIDTLTAYIDVLGQSGNVLASTQGGDSNYIRTRIEAGMVHFVRVVAGDTMATTVPYHLVVHEADY